LDADEKVLQNGERPSYIDISLSTSVDLGNRDLVTQLSQLHHHSAFPARIRVLKYMEEYSWSRDITGWIWPNGNAGISAFTPVDDVEALDASAIQCFDIIKTTT
jgi:hypothetical protein